MPPTAAAEARTGAAPADRIGREALRGTLRIFSADVLLLPAGVLTAAYLTRSLGPGGYGLYSLAAAIVIWLELTITSLFARATLQLVAEADDWRPVGATVTWVHLVAGTLVAIAVIAGGGAIADALGTPSLARPLRLFALDIPIACVATAHRNLLVGVGRYGTRAAGSAARILLRMGLCIGLVAAGFSIDGVIVGVILSSAVEIVIARTAVRPAYRPDPRFATRRVGEIAFPLFLYAASIRLLDKLDIIALQRFGGSLEQVGVYAAAQNFAVAPGLFAVALSSLLQSMLGRLQREGDGAGARALAGGAMRAVILMVPYAALVAGGAAPLMRVIFGDAFESGAPLIALLIFAAMGLLMLAVTSAILVAAGRPFDAVGVAIPAVLAALVGYVIVTPRFGASGAALVTTVAAVGGAVATMLVVYRRWRVAPSAATVTRSAVVAVAIFTAARAAVAGTGDLRSLGALVLLGALIPLLFFAIGELTRRDLSQLGIARA